MNPLFPEIEPYRTGYLRVSPLHRLYFEEVGRPDGQPILFLHGGPGAGLNPKHRRYFDPSHYRVILFDQRGAGKSLPHAELRQNSTPDLIADIEKIRANAGVDKWLVFGGSWGSTLGLAYAIRHPGRVEGLLLRGIFLGRRKEVSWLFQTGASLIYPDAWERFTEPIPPEERHDLVGAYYRRLTGPDLHARLRAAQAWSGWEASVSKLVPDEQLIREFVADHTALAVARLECHYFMNRLFLADDPILPNVPALEGIPCRIVHGRYDMVCPMQSAWELHKALPGSELRIVPEAGHSATDPGLVHELVQATQDFRRPRGCVEGSLEVSIEVS